MDHNLKTLVQTFKKESYVFISDTFVESELGLPYHIPEPKTIDQFFKKRARPEGSAMALLK